jgi:hypothetical protein
MGFKKYASSFFSILFHMFKDPEGTMSQLKWAGESHVKIIVQIFQKKKYKYAGINVL